MPTSLVSTRTPGRLLGLRIIGSCVLTVMLIYLWGCSPGDPVGAKEVDPADLPPVEGPAPSLKVGAHYFPWYGNPDFDDAWFHWGAPSSSPGLPPANIASDFYPSLGPYSSNDVLTVAQHMAWLRQAGIGVVVTSWWGIGAFTDIAVPTLLDQAARYGIKVAFTLDLFPGRSPAIVVDAVEYIYSRYGSHPAFFRTTESTRWSPDARAKGVFYLYGADERAGGEVWQSALDEIHAMPSGGLVLATHTTGIPDGDWLDSGHFDGAYAFLSTGADAQAGIPDYSWALDLPPGFLVSPAVAPGFSSLRIGQLLYVNFDRRDGEAYRQQWEEVVDTGIEPFLVVVTSFNEWHEGTQIEPAAVGATDGAGSPYQSYAPMQPDGYLELTRQLAEETILSAVWTPRTAHNASRR